MKNLVIVESPAKAKTVGKFLGADYTVMSSHGHIRDLKPRSFSIDTKTLDTSSVQILATVGLKNIKNGMEMKYTIVSESEANLRENKISVGTPIAQGLLGKKVGDVAKIKVPAGMIELEITSISFDL